MSKDEALGKSLAQKILRGAVGEFQLEKRLNP